MLIQENGILYVSDYGLDFEEIEHGEPSEDAYGLDTLVRTFEGRTSLLDAFLASWRDASGVPLNTPDTEWPGLTQISIDRISRGRSFSQVGVKFSGKISGAEPLVSIKAGMKPGTFQATGVTSETPPASGVAGVDYLSDSVTYSYCTNTFPAGPRYSNGIIGTGVEITTVGTGGDGIINTAAAHNLSEGANIFLSGISGTVPDINGSTTVKAVTDSDTFTIDTTVSTGGTGGMVYPAANALFITGIRGSVKVGDVYYPITTLDGSSYTVTQENIGFTRTQVGLWWECEETWAWRIGQAHSL